MKVIRTLVYEGSVEWIERTLANSLPNGEINFDGNGDSINPRRITVSTVELKYGYQLNESNQYGVERIKRDGKQSGS